MTSALDMPEIMSYIYIARAGILIQISIVTTDTIFADVGVMIIAVLNAIRCLFVKKL